MSSNLLFEEKQYLGYNKYSAIRRMSFGIFCFLAYYFSENERVTNSVMGKMANIESTGDIFFLMGIVIVVWSTILIFILHIKTQVYDKHIVIDGLWTSRLVKIDLRRIKSVEQIKYSKYLLNRPVYNLHKKGKIRFFTRGNDAVQLTDEEGLKYIVGTQQPILLKETIQNQLPNVN